MNLCAKFFSSLSLSLLLFSSACTGRLASVIPTSVKEIDYQTSFGIREKLKSADESLESYKALIRTTVSHPAGSERFRQAFVFMKPASMRVEFLPLNGLYAVGLLTANEKGAVYIDSQEKKVQISSSAQTLISAILNMPSDVSQLMSYMTGRIPPEFLTSDLHIYSGGGTQDIVLISTDNSFKGYLSDDLTARSFEIWQGEELKIQFIYKKYLRLKDLLVPESMEINIADEQVKISLEATNLQINNKVDQNLFDVEIPPDYEVERN